MRYVSSTHEISYNEFVKSMSPGYIEFLGKRGIIDKVRKQAWRDYYSIEPGEKHVVEIDEEGVISSIWITINGSYVGFLRKTIMRIYWDSETTPSVDAPIGDFFLIGHRSYSHDRTPRGNVLALPVGASSGGLYCFFPMPFKKMRLEFVNLGSDVISNLYYIIGYYVGEDTSEMPRFHAQWNREKKTRLGSDYLAICTNGSGCYVGIYLYVRGLCLRPPFMGRLGFLEGNVKVICDGELSYCSTGTEDYFLGGWYFINGSFNGVFHGVPHKDESNSEISMYRFHVLDPIPFKKQLEVKVPHGELNEVVADYSSVVYWYQFEPHKVEIKTDFSILE